jgi:hypothetical protein
MKRAYGWKPELPDARDRYLKVPKLRYLLKRFPDELDYEPLCSDVEDQDIIGSCIGHGCVGAMELEDRFPDGIWTELSRLFGYWILREDKEHDTGGYIRDAIKAIARYGICDEKLWPYDVSRFAEKPPREAFEDALKRSGIEYYRIADDDRLNGIRSVLFENKRGVIFGFSVYRNLNSEEVAKSGILELPTYEDLSAGLLGGHCVLIVGWKWIKNRLYFKCRNSWGKAWGIRGYFYMSAEYVCDPDLADDFWAILKTPRIKLNGEEPWQPDLSGAKWYVPLTTIWRIIKTIFIKGGKK